MLYTRLVDTQRLRRLDRREFTWRSGALVRFYFNVQVLVTWLCSMEIKGIIHIGYVHVWHVYALMKSKNISNITMFSLHSHRLLPEYRFPIQFEDVYSSFKWFLRKEVLAKYGVNPERIGVVGCSSGGNLAAAIVQKVWCSSFLSCIFKKCLLINYFNIYVKT